MKENLTQNEAMAEIKRLLHLSQDSEDKVVLRWDGMGAEIGYGKFYGASKRTYTKAWKLAKYYNIDIIPIHRKVLEERRKY